MKKLYLVFHNTDKYYFDKKHYTDTHMFVYQVISELSNEYVSRQLRHPYFRFKSNDLIYFSIPINEVLHIKGKDQ